MAPRFFLNVTSVFSGMLVAQVIPFLGTIALARIFDAASFGAFSVWLGIVLILSVVLTGRFESSLAIEQDGAFRRAAVAMTLTTTALTSFFVFFILSAGISLGVADHAELPKVLMVLIVPVAALVAATQTLQNWAAADGRYKQLSYIRVIQAAAIIIFQIALSVISSSPVSLALGYLAGIAVGFSIGIFLCPLSRNDFQSPVSRLIVFWSERRRFPIFSLPADLINTAASQLPVVIIAVRFGAEPAGLVAMAQRMLGAPMSLLAVSILDVFKRHAGQAYLSRGECREEYVDAFRLLVVLAASSAIAILISAEYAFTIVLGDAWIEAGTIAIWLMPRFIIGFVASPLSYMVYIAGKQHLDLMWQLVLLGMTVLTLYIMGASMKASLLSYGVCYGGLYLIYLIMSYRFSLGVKH